MDVSVFVSLCVNCQNESSIDFNPNPNRLIDDINTIFFLNDFMVISTAAVASVFEFFTCMTVCKISDFLLLVFNLIN